VRIREAIQMGFDRIVLPSANVDLADLGNGLAREASGEAGAPSVVSGQ
jgi:hypothetical protein